MSVLPSGDRWLLTGMEEEEGTEEGKWLPPPPYRLFTTGFTRLIWLWPEIRTNAILTVLARTQLSISSHYNTAFNQFPQEHSFQSMLIATQHSINFS